MSTPSFDPNGPALLDSGIFGLPYSKDEAAVVYLPVPWEATTSFGGGTADGPAAIVEASRQVDLYDLEILRPYAPGLHMLPESSEVRAWNAAARGLAKRVIDDVIRGGNNPEIESWRSQVNDFGTKLNHYVFEETRRLLRDGKIVGVVGGDHSVPFGALQAIAERHSSFGILHIDAHADVRHAYEGFTWSHGSIMGNVLDHIPQMTQMVQVGIRDVGEDEVDTLAAQGDRVRTFYDIAMRRRLFEGESWGSVTKDIVASLPKEVWISFDIDGLNPALCPHTGTPVPGGMDIQEVLYLFRTLVRSGRTIVGFDLNEIAPGPSEFEASWDANVGARLLYKLTGWALVSQGRTIERPLR